MLDNKDKRSLSMKGVKMHNAGVKYKRFDSPVCSSSKSKDRIDYPTLYLSAKQAPSLVGRDVEDNITLIVKGKITSHSKNERRGSDGRENFDIEIRQIGCLTPKK